MQQYISGFEISMNNVVLVKTFEALHNIAENSQSFLLSESPLFLDIAVEAASIAVFTNKVKVTFRP